MDNIQNTIDTILKQGILPLYFNTDEIISLAILRALYKAGIKAVEYTNRGPEAIANFKKMVAIRDLEMPEMLLGIGTIKNIEQAKQYYEIGADFFISPGFVPEVSQFLQSKERLYCPGCMTPTEIITAENAGIKFIKLFPGNILSPKFMNNIKDIFPAIYFMTTGGVDTTHTSINSWFSAGVSAVGLGSKLITQERTDNGDYDGIESETRKVLQIVQIIQKQL